MSCTYDGTTLGETETVHDEWNYPSFPDMYPDPADQYLMYLTAPIQLSSGVWAFTVSLYYKVGDEDMFPQCYMKWAPGGFRLAIMAECGSVMLGKPGYGVMI